MNNSHRHIYTLIKALLSENPCQGKITRSKERVTGHLNIQLFRSATRNEIRLQAFKPDETKLLSLIKNLHVTGADWAKMAIDMETQIAQISFAFTL